MTNISSPNCRFWLLLVLAGLLGTGAVSHAATPAHAAVEGEWRVADGTAQVRIVPCGDTLVGAISWEKQPGFDSQNPDEAKRKLPILGLPILRHLRAEPTDRWVGEIYNADNGKLYDGSISLVAPDRLHIEGCLISGVMCGGEDWSRVSAKPAKGLRNATICQRAAAN